ncbi:efflux RND transporter periplasmic adaptor subunit [Dokdonella koreensis]|uniref:RND efflux system, membrane fusion protein CmeA n=1 Tax=Dokdonella koreensis DS-123 TaxID=1300342 RepID=A0A167G491_9GAMM|nr:efflux RND transporter periplasmic adaptor subunit [Dokdonella koreensis]ANB16139.1 RND efflux system, membrane fusion protein CmeA [Dokdonella koreensis DS-123]
MSAFRYSVLILGLAALIGGCSRGAADTAAAAAPPPTEVTVAAVVAKPLRDWEEFTGRLEAVDSVEIRPRVSGFIDSVQFAEGSRVKKGQLLFRIDPRPFQAEVNRLAAALKQARSQAQLATSNHERGQRLVAQHMISRQEFDQLATLASTSADGIGAAAAALEAARLNLEFTEVRSPIDGRVSRALITAGNLASNASVLTTVVSDNPVYAYFDADEQTYLRFSRTATREADGRHAASPVFMGLIDEQGYPHEGRLDFIDNQVDTQSGTIRGRAVFDNADGRFTPGLFTRIKLVGSESRDTILVDDRAVGIDLGKKFVLALKPDNTLEYRFVELGAAIDGLRVVKQGLSQGDVIVVNGLQHVRPGVTVKPTTVTMDANRTGVAQVTAGESPLLASRAAPTEHAQR